VASGDTIRVETMVARGLQRLRATNAYFLCTLAADLHVTQLVDGTKGVHAMMPKSIFAK
jgi:acetamidase/formamidase